ncbi:MAG: ABC transporter ATP-binding protein [Pseudomonadota bacterium]
MARVEIDKLSFSVGATRILREVDLTVEEGRCLALLGPSGCGKTTTLRSVAGFVRPSSGDVRLGGRSVLGLPPHKRNVGLVFQDYALFPHMTVLENVAYGLRMRRVPEPERTRRAEAALDLVQMTEFAERTPNALSGGQRQRVALARALVIEPDVLLLDEPLGALDRKLRDQMQVELKRIQREARVTTIIVTHDQEEALSLSDRVAVMFGGEIAAVDAPAALYRAPKSEAVMSFLGASNIFEGEAEPGPDGASVRLAGGGPVLRSAARAAAAGTVSIGVRPERIALLREGEGSGAAATGDVNRLAGVIADVVYKGPHAEVFVTADGGARWSVHWSDAAAAAGDAPAPGARVTLEISRESVLILS